MPPLLPNNWAPDCAIVYGQTEIAILLFSKWSYPSSPPAQLTVSVINSWQIQMVIVFLLMHFKSICLVLSLCPIQIKRQYRPYPRHWKSNQQIPVQPKSLGEQIKKHRLELRLRQKDVAAEIGISSVSLSSWERGVSLPSNRMKKKILKFLEFAPAPIQENDALISVNSVEFQQQRTSVASLKMSASNSMEINCDHNFA